MTNRLSKQRLSWFILLLSVVIISNILLYRLEMGEPIPHAVALGSLFDFIIVVPLLCYLFVIRKRYSLKYVWLVALASFAFAWFIIPNEHLTYYPFVKYLFFAGEGTFLLFELYIVFIIVRKLPNMIKSFREQQTDIPFFHYRLDKALIGHMKSSRAIEIIKSEVTMFFYSLFSWRKHTSDSINGTVFTYHKNSSVIAFYIMIIHAIVIESIGFHFLLHSWNAIVAIIALILNIYAIFLFIGEVQAIRLCPFVITNKNLHLHVGMMKRMVIPIEKIESIHFYDGPEKLMKAERKHIYDAAIADFMKEKPTFEITLKGPVKAKYMYGFTKQVTKVHVTVDNNQLFYETLIKQIEVKNE